MTPFRRYIAVVIFILVLACLAGRFVSQGAPPAPLMPLLRPSPTLTVEQRVTALEDKLDKPEEKDVWDIISAVSGLISAGVIAGLLAFLARRYQQQQDSIANTQKERELKIAQAQAVHSLGTHLLSEEPKRVEYAIGLIGALDARLAMDLAYIIGGAAGFHALWQIVILTTETPEQQAIARARLQELGERRLEERLGRLAEVTGRPVEELEEELEKFLSEVKQEP